MPVAKAILFSGSISTAIAGTVISEYFLKENDTWVPPLLASASFGFSAAYSWVKNSEMEEDIETLQKAIKILELVSIIYFIVTS